MSWYSSVYNWVWISIFGEAPLTTNAWREPFVWNEELQTKIHDDIEQLTPDPKPSVLLLGATNAGKSAFVNSSLSVATGRRVEIAQTGDAPTSFTLTYDQYTKGSLLDRFTLTDCRGIESTWNRECCVEDIVCALKGHIMDGYEFQPNERIKENNKFFRKNPDFTHQIHCVVFVVDIKAINMSISPEYFQIIKELQQKVKELRIPKVLVLTKADMFCEEVEKDISNLFYSKKVRNAVRLASEIFNIPEASIHPVKNYVHEIELNVRKNIQILLAMRQILQYANDWVEQHGQK